MSISELLSKIKGYGTYLGKRDIYAVFMIIIVGFGCFFLGMLYQKETGAPDIRLSQVSGSVLDVPKKSSETTNFINQTSSSKVETVEAAAPSSQSTSYPGAYVASKNSDKFHLPTCPGAQQISPANKIWFQTKEEALAKGYVPASNCKGI